MAEYKPGEVIELEVNQENDQGQIIMEVSARFYGYSNAEANAGSAAAIIDVLKGAQTFKGSGGATAPKPR